MIFDFSFQNEIRNAPEVEYRSGRSRLCAGLLTFLYILAAIQLSFWAITSPDLDWRFLTSLVATHSVLLIALGGYFFSPRACIRWLPTEEIWFVERDRAGGDSSSRQISHLWVAFDFCDSLLLRVQDGVHDGALKHWFWFVRSDAPDEWKSFRRALYSPATSRLFSQSPKVSTA